MRLLEMDLGSVPAERRARPADSRIREAEDREVVVFTVYNLFKFLHIVAVIIWIGGAVMVGILNARVGRTGDRSAMATLGQQSAVLGRTLIGPAAAIAFVAGFVMIVDGGIEFTTL
jgi:uncharacterized membrane protein